MEGLELEAGDGDQTARTYKTTVEAG